MLLISTTRSSMLVCVCLFFFSSSTHRHIHTPFITLSICFHIFFLPFHVIKTSSSHFFSFHSNPFQIPLSALLFFCAAAAAAPEEMKFGKKLKIQIQETLPEWQDKFLCYKDLKKLVRLISSVPSVSSTLARRRFSDDQSSLEKVEAEFVYLLNIEIEKFNAFFMEQEEDFIIRHEELQQRIQRVIATLGPDGSQPSEKDYKEEMERIRNDIVNFHGEMVLLENYSNINYTGLAKILKKYDKRTGGILRLPFIQSVLQQPFFTTDLVSKLVKECESTIEAIFSTLEEEEVEEGRKGTTTVVGLAAGLEGGIIFRNTIAALVTMKEMRRSSTYSQFSLPPLNLPESDIIQSLQLNSAIPIL